MIQKNIYSKETKNKVHWKGNTFLINDKPTILYSGEVQYFRVPYQEWEKRLKKAVALGINCISTYIPWNWHEKIKGELRWDQQYNLQEFLEICKKLGLYVIVKPGPYICAEWDSGGLPLWILQKNITLRSADSEYIDLVSHWYGEVIQKVTPYLITHNGTIILFQIENEYEHYLTYDSTCGINKEEGKRYLTQLLTIVEKKGVDIPIYLNGSPTLSKELDLIDAVDFWSDIPFLWHFEFKLFNKFLENAFLREKPLFISELQAGWYDQVGEKHYDAPDILEANIKNAIGHRAAIINIFMLAGGTTPPDYSCKGDSVLCSGIENTTSYDFGAPIRESGGYNFRKASDILLGEKLIQTYNKVISCGEQVDDLEIKSSSANIIGFNNNPVEDILNLSGIICKRFSCENQGFLYVNNLSDFTHNIQLIAKVDSSLPLSLSIESKKSYILPFQHQINNITIQRSNAEVYFFKTKDYEKSLIFVIAEGVNNPELIIKTNLSIHSDNPLVKIYSVARNVYKIVHMRDELELIQIDSKFFIFFVPKKIAPFVRQVENLVMFPNEGIILNENSDTQNGKFELDIQPKSDFLMEMFPLTGNKFNIRINGQPIKLFKKHNSRPFWCLNFNNLSNQNLAPSITKLIQWSNKWSAENWDKEVVFSNDDSNWRTSNLNVPLEKMSNIRLGYIFYRLKFSVTDFSGDYELEYDGGDIHKSYIYINEKLVFSGKGKTNIKLSGLIKENNILAIRYLYHFHTKGYHNSGPFIQYSGVKKIVLQNISTLKSTEFLNLKIKSIPLDDLFFIGDNEQPLFNLPTDRTLWIFYSKGLIHLKRKFLFSFPEEQWDTSLGLKVVGVRERALIYINGKLLGKYEYNSPQEIFYIPFEILKAENSLDLIIEGPGLNRVDEPEYPSFGEIQFVYMHCKQKLRLELEYIKD